MENMEETSVWAGGMLRIKRVLRVLGARSQVATPKQVKKDVKKT